MKEIRVFEGKKRPLLFAVLVVTILVTSFSVFTFFENSELPSLLINFLIGIILGTLFIVAHILLPSTLKVVISRQGIALEFVDNTKSRLKSRVKKFISFSEILGISSDRKRNLLLIETSERTYSLECHQMEEVIKKSRMPISATDIEDAISNFTEISRKPNKEKLRLVDSQISDILNHPTHKYFFISFLIILIAIAYYRLL